MIAFDAYVEPELRTARLVLEPLTAWHADALYEGLRDPTLYAFIAEEPPIGPKALAERFERLESRRSPDSDMLWLNWAIRRVGGGYAGRAEASAWPDGLAEIAYVMFASAQGQGLAREAMGAVVAHLFEIGAISIRAMIDTRNRPSQRVAEALGFRRERLHEKTDKLRGRWVDDWEYRLDRISGSPR